MILEKKSDKIWIIETFLSSKECTELINFSEQQGYEEAQVSLSSGPKMMKGIRNNDRLIHTDSALANKLWNKLSSFCPTNIDNTHPVGLNEMFRFYKYGPEEKFKRHIDGRYKRNDHEESRITFLIYLNDEYEGGETKFDDITIHPEKGTALLFIHEQKHESTPISSGTKYVLRSDVMYQSK